jgi:hypothetical protein
MKHVIKAISVKDYPPGEIVQWFRRLSSLPLRKGGGKASHQTALQEKGILVLSFLKII